MAFQSRCVYTVGLKRGGFTHSPDNLLIKLIEKYVKAGREAKPYQPQPKSETKTLFMASEKGEIESVRQFLNQETTQVNQRYQPYERTALHQAAEHGHFEIVKLLVEHGADVFARNNHGRTPRELALQSQYEIVNFLREKEDQRSRDR